MHINVTDAMPLIPCSLCYKQEQNQKHKTLSLYTIHDMFGAYNKQHL